MSEAPFLTTDRMPLLEVRLGDKIIPAATFVQSVSIEWGLNTSFSCEIDFYDKTETTVEQAIIEAATLAQRVCEIKFGWLDGPTNIFRSTIVDYIPTFDHTGAQIKMTGRINVGTDLMKTLQSWPENTPPDQVVNDIISPLGIKGVLEPAEPWTRPIQANNVYPLAWIRDTFCSPKGGGCIASSGKPGPYHLYWGIDGTLHFHTPSFGSGGVATRKYIFARSRMGQVLSYQPHDNTLHTTILGAGKNLFEWVDPLEGTVNQEKMSYSGEDGYEQQEVDAAGGLKAANIPATDGQPSQCCRTPERDKKTVKCRQQTIYEYFAQRLYTADLSIIGDPNVQMNELIQVMRLTPENKVHYLSGVYRVMGVKHTLNSSGFTTDLHLTRAGALEGSVSLSGQQAQTTTASPDNSVQLTRNVPSV